MAFWTISRALSFLLFALATSAQELTPSNTSTPIHGYAGQIELQDTSGANLSTLVPLTNNATTASGISGALYLTNETSSTNITAGDIAYISCNIADYPGNLNAANVLASVTGKQISAVVFYSTEADYCVYTSANPSMQLPDSPIYSMSSRDASQKLLTNAENIAIKDIVSVRVYGGDNGTNGSAQSQNSGSGNNPLGPSPSTAVAMIILYSITGIITALFLVIIITGAIRAHRNPERYGPRDVLGRPRQSRARGIGRAILDTIPIVKFGERDPAKPADVELGSTPEAQNVTEGTEETRAHDANETTTETTATDANETREAPAEQPSGIAPAQPLAAAAVASHNDATNDENLGCSICTDDFEMGQDLRVLPCNHKFHPECVDPWLLNVSGTCPLCRVDLRPTTSRTSGTDEDADADQDTLAPPLQPETDPSYRRRSALRDILSLRSRPNASTEERISALRRLREQRQNGSGEVAASGSANASSEDVTNVRRSRRISARFHEAFSIRTRRNGVEDAGAGAGEASASSAAAPARTEAEDAQAQLPPLSTIASHDEHEHEHEHEPDRAGRS